MLTWIIVTLVILAFNAVILSFIELICVIFYLLFQCLAKVMPYILIAIGYIFMGIVKTIKSIFYLIISIFRKDKEHRRTKREHYFTDDLKRRYERYHDCEVVWDSNKKCYVPKR